MAESRRKVAFGGLRERFDYKGIHPSWDRRCYTYRYPHLGPGYYYSERKRKPKGIGFQLSKESEEFSRNLAYRAESRFKEKAWQSSILGPGWHHVKENDGIKLGRFSMANRFPAEKTSSTPGPGTYGKEHIPHLRMEEKARFKSFSDTPTFEFNNCMSRSMNIQRSYHLPPNIYRMKSFADEIISKVISKRGPYDLFTGARDETSLYGHYWKPKVRFEGRLVSLPGASESLNNACNRYKGKFPTCGRETYPITRASLTNPALCKPDQDKPAPNRYSPREVSKPSNAIGFPFNSSVLHVRPLKKIELKPHPGRYDHFQKRWILGDGWRSNFLSKVKRGLPLPAKNSWY